MTTASRSHTLSTDDRKHLNEDTFAFPGKRKEPLNNASHVRNAIARFDQVKDVTDKEREEAFHNIKAAAKKYGVDMTETSWHQLGHKPHTANSAHK
jgi:hypothetical protein